MNGKAHQKAANLVIAAGVLATPWAMAQGVSFGLYLGFVGGLVLGKFADPDLRDQEQVRNESEHEFTRLFGKMPGRAWSAFWYIPAKAINHRSKLSHLPPLGMFVAAAWLGIPLALLAYAVVQPDIGFVDWAGRLAVNEYCIAAFAGWFFQDVIHRLMDFKFLYPLFRVVL